MLKRINTLARQSMKMNKCSTKVRKMATKLVWRPPLQSMLITNTNSSISIIYFTPKSPCLSPRWITHEISTNYGELMKLAQINTRHVDNIGDSGTLAPLIYLSIYLAIFQYCSNLNWLRTSEQVCVLRVSRELKEGVHMSQKPTGWQ